MSDFPLLGLSFAAGGLSTLAPCVLPILPFVLKTATNEHRMGPIAVGAGLVGSFTLFGAISSIFAAQLDMDLIRKLAAVILILSGLTFLVPILKETLSRFLQPLANRANIFSGRSSVTQGLSGQFFLGTILGVIWAPCTGPTLGIAIGLASQQSELPKAISMFLFFGLGAAISLMTFGFLLSKLRGKVFKHGLMRGTAIANYLMGSLAVVLGALILFGFEGEVEEVILNILPTFLVKATTLF